jgi:hypothetical protein
LRDQAKALAPVLGRHTELGVLERLIGATLNTRDDIRLTSKALATRAAGAPVDQRRVESFARLADVLENMSPDVVPALPIDEPRRVLLPFYEAYFSNFIEGTEFTLEEAADIVFEQRVPAERPQDAHDVLGTYRITNDLAAMRTVPRSSQELLDLSRERHAILMEARPDKLPGRWKERPNRAGQTEFVDPDLVVGTLRAGFDRATDLTSPFARAVYMMFLVSEVHPFADGNGRIARLMMNSELVAAGEVRIIIPTVYRLNYLSALKGATHTGNDRALIAALAFARRWTSRVNFASRQEAEWDMARTNALRDARDAEEAGVRLTLP